MAKTRIEKMYGKKKEVIAPPKKNSLSDGSRQLKKGHPSGGRTLSDEAQAVRQGVVPKKKPRK